MIIGKADALYTPAHHPTKPILAGDNLLGKREVEYHTTRIVNIVTCTDPATNGKTSDTSPKTCPDLTIANNERQDTIITSKAALKKSLPKIIYYLHNDHFDSIYVSVPLYFAILITVLPVQNFFKKTRG